MLGKKGWKWAKLQAEREGRIETRRRYVGSYKSARLGPGGVRRFAQVLEETTLITYPSTEKRHYQRMMFHRLRSDARYHSEKPKCLVPDFGNKQWCFWISNRGPSHLQSSRRLRAVSRCSKYACRSQWIVLGGLGSWVARIASSTPALGHLKTAKSF